MRISGYTVVSTQRRESALAPPSEKDLDQGGTSMRRMMLFLAAFFSVGSLAAVALAASPHFLHGSSPSCTFSTSPGGTATDTASCGGGTLAGLGQEDLGLKLSGSAEGTFLCTNKGGNSAPGANKVPLFVPTGEKIIPANEIKNGTLTLTSVSVTVPTPTATAEEAGCPNGTTWHTTIKSIAFTSVTLVISQPPGTPIFTCTASNPSGFKSGEKVTLSCTAA
jgi:hypothetical protein